MDGSGVRVGKHGVRLVFNGILNDADRSGYLHAPRTPEELLAEIGGDSVSPPASRAPMARC